MNHLEKRIKQRYPNEDISVLEYTGMQYPAKVKCNFCRSEYSLKRAQNFLRKNKKCICKKCINNKSGGRLTLSEFQQKIDKLYPEQKLTVLNYTLKNRPCTIRCDFCGEQYTLQNAESFYNKNKKRICKKCLPNKRKQIQKSLNDFIKWAKQQDAFVFENIPEKINSKTLIQGFCQKCKKQSKKNIYDYIKGKGCKYCAKNNLKTLEQFQNEIGEQYTVLIYNGMDKKSKFKHNLCGFVYQNNSKNYSCPRCKGSKGERKIRYILMKNNINFEEQKVFLIKGHKLRVDFFLPDFKIALQYNGQQHYKPIPYFNGIQGFKKQQLYDNYKREYFGDKLYQISYLDFKNIEFILNDLLNLKSSSTISKESREAETVASQSGYFLI